MTVRGMEPPQASALGVTRRRANRNMNGGHSTPRGTLSIVRRRAGNLSAIASEVESHLIDAGVGFYQRGGVLVRPVSCPVSASDGRQTTAVRLVDVSIPYMRDMMGRHIRFQRYLRREKDYVDIDAPGDLAETIIARAGDWSFAPIQGVLTTQTLRVDGTILAEAGYDAKTQLLLVDPPILPPIPDNPSKDEAGRALQTLQELLTEFPFVDETSRSVALAAIITVVVRGAFPVTPAYVASSPTPGTGKSTLWDVVSAVATGQPCSVIAAGREEAETEKRLVACVIAGYPLFSIDNLNGELGGDFLCQLTERPLLSVRVLGRSEQPLIPNRTTVLATGNNIRLRGDMARRGLSVRTRCAHRATGVAPVQRQSGPGGTGASRPVCRRRAYDCTRLCRRRSARQSIVIRKLR